MQKILKKFLEDNLLSDALNEDFDYSFSYKDEENKFFLEFRKFLRVYNAFFYHNNRLVTVFNSYEIRIEKKDLKAIIFLYLYAEEKKLLYYKYIIQDFLYTYSNTINSKDYKINRYDYKDSKCDFREAVDEFNARAKIYVETPKDLYLFYKKLIVYGFKNDIFIDGETISKIFNNLKFARIDYSDLIELFILNKKNICNIVHFDCEKNKHINAYFDYIIKSLETFGGYNYVKEIVFELDKAKCLTDKLNDTLINKYINVTNNLVNKLKTKKYSFIQGIAELESLKRELIYYIKNIESFNEIQKKKIKECLSRLLNIKRYIISDDNYVKSEMHESVYEQKMPKEEVEFYRRSLLENKFKLYAASSIKFTEELKNALESYAEHPILSLTSRYTIDSKREVYSLCIEDLPRICEDNFKKYFDEKGFKYTKEHSKLLNKLSCNYYEELLRYMSMTFRLHQSILISTITKADFNYIIEELKKSIGYNFDNEYALVVSNILAIEINVIKILEKNNIKIEKDGFKNINRLFEIYNNDEGIANGIMYLNYILYEKSGLNLRNNAMHGTLINEKLEIPLIVSFSGLIFISWLLNGK